MIAWTPGALLYPSLYADTREYRSRITVTPSGIDASLGEGFAVLGDSPTGEAATDSLHWRAGIAAGIYMNFHPSGPLIFDMETADGRIGLPVDLRSGRWTARLVWAHESAHLVDGVRRDDARPDKQAVTQSFSREWLYAGAAVRLGPVRPYAATRFIVHQVEDTGGGVALQVGATVDGGDRFGPYGGVDLQGWSATDWVPTVTAQAGVRLGPRDGDALRFGIAAYYGLDDAGKFEGRSKSYLGLTLGYDRRRAE